MSSAPRSSDTADDVEVRSARPDDQAGIFAVARDALGWSDEDADQAFLAWKHLENPFGVSPMWVAVDGDRIVGYRAFLRWRFVRPDGSKVLAVRAVDTATAPSHQRRGLFTRLTLGALDGLRADGIELVFNTPNERSRPGYLKMGWTTVGRLPAAVRPTRLRSLARIAGARGATERGSLDSEAGDPAAIVLSNSSGVTHLLGTLPADGGLATDRSAGLLAWRYGHAPLRYRAVCAGRAPEDGMAVFRLRRRGDALVAVVCELLVPEGAHGVRRALLARIARETGADFLLRLGAGWLSERFVRAPGLGPILVCRPLDGSDAPALDEWTLSTGDAELL